MLVLLLILGLGGIDYLTGFKISFALFYVFPVSMAAWFLGARPGVLISLLCAIVWQTANILAGETWSSPVIPYWNAATRLGFFLIVSLLVADLRRVLRREQELSRVDGLTGLLNRRAFYDAAEAEIERIRRLGYALTTVYLDLDNFKMVNDTQGHAVGDAVLQKVAQVLCGHVRRIDRVARLGGDEFGILLVETGEASAREVVTRLQAVLRETSQALHWPVTFSLGVLTCRMAPGGVDEVIRHADRLMYEVKKEGKDAVRYSTWPD